MSLWRMRGAMMVAGRGEQSAVGAQGRVVSSSLWSQERSPGPSDDTAEI